MSEAVIEPTQETYDPNLNPTPTEDGNSAHELMARWNKMQKGDEQQQAEPEPTPEPKKEVAKPKAKVEKAAPKEEPKQEATVEEPKEEIPDLDTPLAELGKKEEATEEAKPASEDTPKGLSEKAKVKWGELREKADKYDALQKQLQEMEVKLKARESADPERFQKEIEEREARLQEYEKKLAIKDIQESKQFQEEVISPMKNINTTVARISQMYEMQPDNIKVALLITDPLERERELIKLTDGMNQVHAAKVWTMAEEVTKLQARAEELENNALNAKKELEFISQQEAEKQKEQKRAELKVYAEKVQQQFKGKIPDLKDEALAKQVFSAELEVDRPELVAYRAYAGAYLPKVLTDNANLKVELAELKKVLEERNAASPKAGPGGTSSVQTQPQEIEGDDMWTRAKNAGLVR